MLNNPTLIFLICFVVGCLLLGYIFEQIAFKSKRVEQFINSLPGVKHE